MGVLSRNHVSEPVPRISQQPHGVLATLIRLPWLWAILLLASAVRFYGSTASAIWCDEGSSLLLSQFSLAGIWLHAARDVHPPLFDDPQARLYLTCDTGECGRERGRSPLEAINHLLKN